MPSLNREAKWPAFGKIMFYIIETEAEAGT